MSPFSHLEKLDSNRGRLNFCHFVAYGNKVFFADGCAGIGVLIIQLAITKIEL